MATITPAAFSAPTSCETPYYGTLSGDVGPAIRRGVRCANNNLFWDPACYPQSLAAESGCPFGYESAVPWSSGSVCCPFGFAYPQATAAPSADCVRDYGNDTYIGAACVAGLNSVQRTYSEEYIYSIFARAITLTAASSSTSSAGSSSIPSPTASPSPSEPSNTSASSTGASITSTTPATEDSSLSKGAIAGIVVAAVAAIALILAALLLWRRKRRHTTVAPPPNTMGYGMQPNAELSENVVYKHNGATVVHQAPSPHPPSELAADQERRYMG